MWPICPSKVKLVEDVALFSVLFLKKSLMILLWLLWKLGYSTTTLYFGCGLLVFMGWFIPRDPISMVHNIHITSGPIRLKKSIVRGWLSFSWCYHYLCRDIWVWPHTQPANMCNAIITSAFAMLSSWVWMVMTKW